MRLVGAPCLQPSSRAGGSMARSTGNPFTVRTRRAVPDPSPNALTDEERQHIVDRLSAGAQVRAGLVRKLVRLCDARQVQIQRSQRVLEQQLALPRHYPGDKACAIVAEILSGKDSL